MAELDSVSKNTQSGKGEAVSILDYFVMNGSPIQSKRSIEELGKLLENESAAHQMNIFLYSVLNNSNDSYHGLPGDRATVDFRPLIPHLVTFVKKDISYISGKHRVCQKIAIEVLVQVAVPADSVPALVFVIENDHASSQEALDALGQMKEAAKETIPVLERYKQKTSSPDSPNESVQKIINRIRGL